ncbi:MAG: GNAT family N-acetyltransferase [Candidatus Dojkabacteria bacterium]|nr:MAG: GNAT family N-acetyltransferase [Candidatus Dojkabacteria bacterium]
MKKKQTRTEQFEYTVPVKVISPFTRETPKGFRLSGFREIKNGKDELRYDMHVISSDQNAAYAVMKRVRGKLYLDGLYVAPEFRSLGLASYLLDTVMINHADEDIYLLARPMKDKNMSEKELQLFYSRFGFSVVDKKGTMVRSAVKPLEMHVPRTSPEL